MKSVMQSGYLMLLLPVCWSLLAGAEVRAEAPAPAGQWEEFVSYDGRFRILTPGPFKQKVDSIDTRLGPLAYHTFFHQPEGEAQENVLYMVSYCDYPAGTVHSDSLELLDEFFQATMEAATSSVRGELLYADDIRLDRYPGKVWRIDYLNGKAVIKTRAYVVGTRFYTVQTIMVRQRSLNRASDRFLDSFRLLE